MSKTSWWVIIVILAVVVVGVWIWKLGGFVKPVEEEEPSGEETATSTATSTDAGTEPEAGADTTSDIQEQLEGIDIEDVEGEMDSIDKELQNL